MSLQFIPISTPEQTAALASLASEIWHEYFPALLSAQQIDYMVEKFQSESAITAQIHDQGYEYFFITDGTGTLGYTGIHADNGKLFLSKLYLQKAFRGKGYAAQAFGFLEGICRRRGLSAIWLTVNRHNDRAIAAYVRSGFQTVREQVVPIGNGYVMDDYVMEKNILKG